MTKLKKESEEYWKGYVYSRNQIIREVLKKIKRLELEFLPEEYVGLVNRLKLELRDLKLYKEGKEE